MAPQPLLFFLDQPGICHFISMNFHITPDRWKNYSKISPRKIYEKFKFYLLGQHSEFYLLGQAVLRQRV